MLYDFHTHTTLSDGTSSPAELIRFAIAQGYDAVALTDHSGPGEMERIISEVRQACVLAQERWNFAALPGIELTHVPASAISELAAEARQLGAVIIVVHGETLAEPVEPGTNLAAIACPHVDVLAHPGNLTEEEARLAAETGVFIEITARPLHCLGNGQVAAMARSHGAKMIVNSDTHEPGDLLTEQLAYNVARGAGLDAEMIKQVLEVNPQQLLARAQLRMKKGMR